MKTYVKDFIRRGIMWAWGGPVVLAIVWLCLKKSGVMTTLSIDEAALGIFTTFVMAFIAAGVSIVYQIETLPKAFAGLIQFAFLYIDYLGFYLVNGWIPLKGIWNFTLIFVIIFAIIWFSIYISIWIKVNKMNQIMK